MCVLHGVFVSVKLTKNAQVQMVQYPPYEQPYQLANPLQPRMMRYTQQNNGPKTVSDIENFMENRKMRDIPSFHPNSSGFYQGLAPIYCSNKGEWTFLHKAIVHRSSLEEFIKNLDVEIPTKQRCLLKALLAL